MTQVLPIDDSFDAGTTTYGSSPDLYKRFEPWTSAEAATGFGIECRPGDMTSAFWENQGGTILPYVGQYGSNNAAAAYGDPAGLGVADDLFCAFLWRQTEQVDGSSSIWVNQAVLSGVAGDDGWRYAGVCVRASGQTVTDGNTTDERLTVGDSYWFVLANDSGVACKWLLLRVNSGAVVVLDSSTVSDIAELKLHLGRQIKLDAQDSGANVVLTATTKVNFGQTGSGATSTIFSYTDTSGSNLTTTGRCGFGLNQARVNSDGTTVPVVSNFKVRSGGSLVLRDRFERFAPNLLPAAATDESGSSGRSLQSRWWGSMSSPYFTGELDRTSDRVQVDGGASIYGFFMDALRYGPTQNRSAVFEFSSAGTATVQSGGFLLRGFGFGDVSWTWNDATNTQGYLIYISYLSGTGVWTAYAYRYNPADVANHPGLMATATIGSLSLDTTWTLEVDIQNVGGTGPDNGIPEIDAKLNATTIPWVETGLGGVFVDSGSSLLYDSSAFALQTGAGQGLALNSGGNSPVYADTWQADASPDPPDDASDEATIVIGGEADGSTGLLNLAFEYGYSVEYMTEARVWRYDSGHVYRAAGQAEHRRLWRLEGLFDATDIATLRTFWDDHDGAEVPFNWVEPDDRTVVKACFDMDELLDEEVAPGAFRVSVSLLELFT